MALHKLPKGYSSDFRLPNKKPIGKVELDKSNKYGRNIFAAWNFASREDWLLDYGSNKPAGLVGGSVTLKQGAESYIQSTGNGVSDRIDLGSIDSSNPISLSDESTGGKWTIFFKCRINSGTLSTSAMRLIDKSNGGNAANGWMIYSSGTSLQIWSTGGGEQVESANIPRDSWEEFAIVVDGGNVSIYTKGRNTKTAAAWPSLSTVTTNAAIANWNHSTDRQWDGDIAYIHMHYGVYTEQQVIGYWRNPYQGFKPKNDPVYFTSEAAGGSITVSPTLGTISYSGNATTIGLFGSIDVAAGLGTISYTSNNATIQVSGVIEVSPTLGAISYTSNATTVQVSGSVDVTATLGTISYTSNNTVVDLGGAITVAAGLGTINYVSNDTIVGLAGQIGINATLGTISYTSNNTIVIASNGQSIGEINTSFAGDLYGSNFKPNSITVTFRG